MKSKLNLLQNPVDLTAALVDIESVSHNETAIADAVEAALREVVQTDESIEVSRTDNNVIARTHRGLPQCVVLAGHLDTVPTADNVPSTCGVDAQGRDTLLGCRTVDMKSGDAVYLHAFATLAANQELQRDLTLTMYECGEIAVEFNGLRHSSESHPELLAGDVALLGESSGDAIETGCQGSTRLRLTAHGTRVHSARVWPDDNAVHKLVLVLSRIAAYEPQTVDIDGLAYREGLDAVWLEAGAATNALPDETVLRVNFRFVPNRNVDVAMAYFCEALGLDEFVAGDLAVDVEGVSPGALPGLHAAVTKELVAIAGGVVKPKFGRIDVVCFSVLGIPMISFGPSDPVYCHKKNEQAPVECIMILWEGLWRYLTTAPVAE